MSTKQISVIIASYNDARIADAIASARAFDDIGAVRLVVIDGGSKPEIRDLIAGLMTPDDIFISEEDRGIFDAFNKGLDNCTTDCIGWIGSDDLFTGQVRASEVIAALCDHELFITNLALFSDDVVRRVTYALPARLGLVKYGLNNPHFATFGRASLLKSERFRLDLLGSDIEYFLKIFARKPRVASSSAVAVIMREGGFSTSTSRKGFQLHYELLSAYARQTNWPVALIALVTKTIYKSVNSFYFRLKNVTPGSFLRLGYYPGIAGSKEIPSA